MAMGGRRTTPRRIAIAGGGTSGPGAASPPRKRRAEAPWLGPRFRWPLDKTNARSYNGVHGVPQHTQPRSPRRITAGKGVHSCFASVRIRFECALYEYQTRPAIWAVQSWTGTVWSNLGHFSGESPTPAIRRHCVVPAAEGPPRSPTPLHNRHTGEGRYPDGWGLCLDVSVQFPLPPRTLCRRRHGRAPVAMSSRDHRGSAGSPLRMCGKPVDRIGASSYEVPQKTTVCINFRRNPSPTGCPDAGPQPSPQALPPSAGGPRR